MNMMKGHIKDKSLMIKVKALAVQEFGENVGVIYDDGIMVIHLGEDDTFNFDGGIYSARMDDNGEIYFEKELTAEKMNQAKEMKKKQKDNE